ncbi:MAG: hypothetical protein P8J20_03115 [Novosphingobium sp.]|nr:hypothetical protein [Novosphingobium sp.]
MDLADIQRKKPGGGQPISRHPLFPATVALWFGALFGVGSMAIRPSLIEQAVLAVQLQTIIPSAEPPLGATTQILLALAMAGVGGVLGALLARRIARPRSTKTERKRVTTPPANAQNSDPHSFGQRSARTDQELEGTGATGLRRRQLAMQEDASPREYQERAPLPGGSPQILNVAEFDLEGFEADRQEPVQELVSEANELSDFESIQNYARDLSGKAPKSSDNIQIFGTPQKDEAEDQASPAGQPGFAGSDQSFEADDNEISSNEALGGLIDSQIDGSRPDTAEEAIEGRLADTIVQSSFSTRENEPRNLQTDPDREDNFYEGVNQSDSRNEKIHTVQQFANPEGETFGPPSANNDAVTAEPAEASATGDPSFGVDAEIDFPEEAMVPDNHTPDEVDFVALSRPSSLDADEYSRADVGPELAVRNHFDGVVSANTTSSRILAANLSELSPAELLERLALTLEHSRNHQSTTQQPSAHHLDPAETPAASARALETDSIAAEDSLDLAAPAAANDLKEQATSTDAAKDDELRGQEKEETSGQHIDAPQLAPIPAGLRPIDLGEDTDGELLPSFVPPRHFSMTATTDNTPHKAAEEPIEPVEPEFSEPETACKSEEYSDPGEEKLELEEGYSSLLSLSRIDHQQFVRIEEAEVEDGEAKPFVVFPHEEAASTGPFARPPADSDPKSSSAANDKGAPTPTSEMEERRFDQPDAAEGAAKEDSTPDPQHDPEETERSLKAALATLQRMSGAA